MTDRFAAIASGEIGEKRAPLVFPAPIPHEVKKLYASPCRKPAFPVPKKITTKEETDKEIEALKRRYAPFMEDRVKEESFRTVLSLRNFEYTSPAGEVKAVTVPHYEGPVGDARAWYRTPFSLPEISGEEAVFICFEAVDNIAEVYINGAFAGRHEGFFAPFSFDITPFIKKGENTLAVCVINDYPYNGCPGREDESVALEGDKMYAATGPGYDDAERGWHHCPPGMGIFAPVRVEIHSRLFLYESYARPLPAENAFEVWCSVYNCDYLPPADISLRYTVCGQNHDGTLIENALVIPYTVHAAEDGSTVIYGSEVPADKMILKYYHGENQVKVRFSAPEYRLWTPDEPYLYKVKTELLVSGRVTDCLYTSFGMRSFAFDKENTPKGMPLLNGKPIRLRGANTMGFEQQDVIRGDKDALLYDLLMAKVCRMNFLRLTQRPVQKEIYDLCDKIGLMVQSDLPLFSAMRRTKFGVGITLCEEMAHLLRPHPSNILISYMNEPMANGNDKPHRHLIRSELQDFFACCDKAVLILAPEQAIKHIDGDYDPPGTELPDNHCYATWYNGHGIDLGRLYRGHWIGVADGWYYACGEFGAEGLDPVSLMRRRYPKSWLPQTPEEEKNWSPSMIKNAQSGNMHYFFYDTQDTLEDWVKESCRWQAAATKMQTESYRRDPRMVSFAIHLFIDAWPSGWMKTIVDCERTPKPAFYAYRDALSPVLVSLRTDRKAFFSGETAEIECYLCNDTESKGSGYTLRYEVLSESGEAVASGEAPASLKAGSPLYAGDITFTVPKTEKRETLTVRAALLDEKGNTVHWNEETVTAFSPAASEEGTSLFISASDFFAGQAEYEKLASEGKTVVVYDPEPGVYTVGGKEVKVKACGMRALHFVSRKTGHPLTDGFEKDDFRFWYGDKEDMITPLIRKTFLSDAFVPVLLSGNCLSGSAWGKPLYPALCVGEMRLGKGKILLSTLELEGHMKNPVAVLFRNRLANY